MKKYGFVKVSEDDNYELLCYWNETVLNRMMDSATNTTYVKPVREVLTELKIVPDPFVYASTDALNVRPAKGMAYVDGPRVVTKEEADKFLHELQANPGKTAEYLGYIKSKSEQKQR